MGPPNVGARQVWALVVLMAVPAVFTVAVVTRQTTGFSPVIDSLLPLLTVWVPAAVGWMAVLRTPRDRLPVLLTTLGLTSWAVAGTYTGAEIAAGREVPLVSPADVCYLGFFAFIIAALAVIMCRHSREMAWPVIVDSAVGALGAAAVLAVVLSPILNSALEGPKTAGTALAMAYPFLDFLILAAVIGIGVSPGQNVGRHWVFLVAGLILFAGGDIVWALLKVKGLYVAGTPLDASWAFGLAMIAAWVVLQGTSAGGAKAEDQELLRQVVPGLAIAAGLTVLIVGTQVRVPLLAVVLAGLTLAMAALPLVFRHRIRMAAMERQARTDELTGLPNRRALYADVPQRLAEEPFEQSAILILDLDKFKEINDSLGHHVGDDLLGQVAGRLATQLQPGDFLARIGGDEFVIHLPRCGLEDSEAIAGKLRDALAQPLVLSGTTVYVNASVGISRYPSQGTELALLLRKADLAMYTAKASHTGQHAYRNVDGGPRAELTLAALGDAIAKDELLLHFQPKLMLSTGETRGVEALVRWNHPTLGLLMPDAFLRKFEETGLMGSLTTIVLAKALDQAAVWRDAGQILSVAVNISAPSVIDCGLPDRIEAMARERGVPPSMLTLEITEDLLLGDRKRAREVLMRLRAMGVRIAVDDYGKGYSSLAYLRELPVDELKLDKSFVLAMADDARSTALVVSTIDLAHSLGLEMTAEGVEDQTVYRALREYGCDAAQGFFMSEPLPAAELDAWLANQPAAATQPPPGSAFR